MEAMINNYSTRNSSKGSIATLNFIRLYEEIHPDSVCIQTDEDSNDNRVRHIDAWIDDVPYDVKDNMTFDFKDRECFVAELKNNHGNVGSLYGKQKFFALQQYKDETIFYIIDREKLVQHVEAKLKRIEVDMLRNAVYLIYKRRHENKDDEVTLVPLEDIMLFTHQIIKPDDSD